MTTQPQTVLDVLVKARKLIEKPRQWRKGDPREAGRAGALCAGEAIAAAAGIEDEVRFKACRAVAGSFPVPMWNDAPERTHAEILDAFDRAIAAEQAKQAAS